MGDDWRSERVHPRATRCGRLGKFRRMQHGICWRRHLAMGYLVPPTLLAVMRTYTDEGNGDSGLNSEGPQTEDGTR